MTAVDATKTCSRCKETKSVDLFSRSKQSKDGYESRCKACEAARTRARLRGGTADAEQVEHVPLDSIRVDGGTQMRAGLNQETVAEYAAAMEEAGGWGTFPAAEVYHDGSAYWLADGFHRVAAAKEAGIEAIPAKIHSGDRRAAILHAAQANAKHGLRRTNADKRRAVETLLRDEEWRTWSDAEIARRCAVDPKTVGNARRELEGNREIPDSTVRKTSDGRMVNTANVGANQLRRERPTPTPPKPAKVVYVEPEPTPAVLEIVPGITVRPFGPETWRAKDERDPRNVKELVDYDRDNAVAWARRQAGIVESEPPAAAKGILTPEWIVHVLSNYAPVNADFQTALRAATVDQLQQALNQAVPGGTAVADERYAALQARLGELTQEPEPDNWAAGAVSLDRDWTKEEFDDYAAAHEVIVSPAQAETVTITLSLDAAKQLRAAVLVGALRYHADSATVEHIRLALAEALQE